MEVLPGDTYRVVELAGDGHEVYATTAHVSQLKSWKVLQDPGDDGDEDLELGEQEGQEPNTVKPNQEKDAAPRRNRRNRRPPKYLDDYETK
jgi:hypothetical protein